MLPETPLATTEDVLLWLREMTEESALDVRMTPAGPARHSTAERADVATREWLSVVSDFRTETTRGVRPDVLAGLDAPAVLTQNITLEIDRMPVAARSVAYRNERSGISELRRIVNRISGGSDDGPVVSTYALTEPPRQSHLFLDRELCPNLRTRFLEAWSRAISAATEAVRIGTSDPMELPYPPPGTIFTSYDQQFVRLGDVWHEQDYTLDDVRVWLQEIDAVLGDSRTALRQAQRSVPPTIGGPTRCAHLAPCMTYAPISVPPR